MTQRMYIDFNLIMTEIGIEKNSLLELLGIYCDEMSQELLNASEQLSSQDWAGMQRTIHNIKGVSANLYIQPVFETAAAIDFKLKSKDTKDIGAEMEELIKTYNAAEAEIKLLLMQNHFTSAT